jgi:cytosine/adenosine deaminase-related metal-dependent hydrolase
VKGETVTHHALRAEHVLDWATRGGARALGRDDLGRLEPGRKADVVLDNPYQYTEFKSDSTHGARGSLFGEG